MKQNPIDVKLKQIKAELKKRPLLAFKLGLTLKQLEKLFNGEMFPEKDILKFYETLQTNRQEKCDRLRIALSRVVGNREAVEFSEKIGVSDTTLRNIIDNKPPLPSNDSITKIECFLHYLNGYKVSIDNEYLIDSFVPEQLNSLANKIYEIGRTIQFHSNSIREFEKFIKTDKPKKLNSVEKSQLASPKNVLNYQLEELSKILRQLNTTTEVFLNN